ncbi:hypothetical protein BH10ACT9_BH10ACT9_36480 [soil metagenome]
MEQKKTSQILVWEAMGLREKEPLAAFEKADEALCQELDKSRTKLKLTELPTDPGDLTEWVSALQAASDLSDDRAEHLRELGRMRLEFYDDTTAEADRCAIAHTYVRKVDDLLQPQ